MSRHHPYGGPYDGPGPRRGGSPAGPGPDRAHRFHDGPPRGRGFGRGRGRGGAGAGGGSGGGPYGGYDSGGPTYDQAPPQGDMGAYSGYDAGSQDQFYQSTGFGGPEQYSAPGSSGGFNDNYGGFEDDSGATFGPEGYGNRPSKRGTRRERDDKVHESIIEERIQRERPCRTLFIRNIKYETNSDEVRRQFEEHGEIKTFFDLIANRGMVFVTFYDLRAAERARERLQGSEISGRPIDVHYSLPRDDSVKGSAQNQELQGSLLVTLRNSMTGQPIDDNEVRRKFQQFGDVKAVRPTGERSDQRYVEFYDIRSAEEAFDRLRHQGLQDGVMDIVLAWEETAAQQPGAPRRDERDQFGKGEWDEGPRGHPPRGRGRGRGKGRGGGFGGGGGGEHDEERRPWERDRDRPRRRDEDRGGRGRGRGGYGGDRFDQREGGYGGPGPSPGGGYGGPSGPPSYGPPPVAMPPPVDERLDQARKVQQLLAALKQPQNGGAPPATPPSQPQQPAALPSIPPPAPPPSYYQPPPPSQQPRAPYPGPMPPAPAPGGYPPPSQPQPAPSALQNLPPNLLALLHGVQAQQPRTPPQMPPQQGQYAMPPAPSPSGMMPPMPGMPGGPPMPPGSDYQQLMSYLAAAKRP